MPRKVLIVEDEAITALDLELRLEGLGYEVLGPCADAASALAMAAQERPDLALMDIRIAGPRDGIDAAEEMMSRLGVPVMFLTGQLTETTMHRTRGLNPLGYLNKPFEEHDLRLALDQAWATLAERSGT